MRAVKIILSISLLLLACSIVAGDAEVSNELPDEIKNLDERQIVKPILFHLPTYPIEAFRNRIEADVWIKLKVDQHGLADTAVIVYCDNPNYDFEQAALKAVLKSTYPLKRKRRKLIKSWFYTRVTFTWRQRGWYVDKIENFDIKNNVMLDSCTEENASIPEIKKKGVPNYPRLAKLDKKTAEVWVKVQVEVTGRPVDVVVAKTTDPDGKYGFNEAAIDGAFNCNFRPSICNGKPVKVWVTFPYEFKLYR